MTVTANFLVTTAEDAEEKTAKFVMYFGATEGGPATEAPETPLPGRGRMRIKRVSPNEGTCEVELMGVAAGRRPQARDGRDALDRRHDEAPDLPRLGAAST